MEEGIFMFSLFNDPTGKKVVFVVTSILKVRLFSVKNGKN